MKTRISFILVMTLVAIAIPACSSGTPIQSGPQSGISSADPWKFYVLSVESKAPYPNARPREGWQTVTVEVAAENTTNTPAWFPRNFLTSTRSTDYNAELIDTGDYKREGRAYGLDFYSMVDKEVEHGFMIWPNFRIRFSFFSEIPQKQSLSKLTLKFGGRSYTLDLQKSNPNIKTPFDTVDVIRNKI